MRFVRLHKGSEVGAPGVTLYEVDAAGWVHRQLQVDADGVRFSPEDILLRRPLAIAAMIAHPDAEEITAEEFELHWAEFDHRRRFRARVPDPWQTWRGQLRAGASTRELRWVPSATSPGAGWRRVPGFVRLWVLGDAEQAWACQRELFLDSPITWARDATDERRSPPREVVHAPVLTRTLHGPRAAPAQPV